MNPELWKRAESIFVQCVDVPDLERAAWLDAQCGQNDELRRLVNDLLAGDADAGVVDKVVGNAANELLASQADRWIGRQVGAYTIESRIAEGGMGVVYLAKRSDEQFEQQVAIKLLATALATSDLRQRFLSERQILASLDHPNIAKLLDGGETDDGAPYLVMEYIQGTPIDQYCRDRNLSLDGRLELFISVSSAVQYAHVNLVIHRDIKPSNILVSDDGIPKLLDFGIAKLLDPGASADKMARTKYGARLLTPRHASPEQISGDAITTASDVYTLGFLLYELLTDSAPYQITGATSAANIETTITTEIPPLPSSQAPGDLQKQLRGDLDTIVMKALRKDPRNRYQSVLEFTEDLQRYKAHRPILARRPTKAYLLSRYWRRNRIAATGITATLAAVMIGSVLATAGFIKARESEKVAVAEATNAEAISQFLVSIFQEANPDTSAGKERSVREILEIGRKRVDTELGASPLVQAKVLETLSSVYKSLSDDTQAEALLRQALELLEANAPQDPESRARVLNDLGDVMRKQSHRKDALPLIEKSVALYHDMGSPVSDGYADAINNLALVYQELGRSDDARPLFEEALQLRQQLYAAPHAKIALSLHNLGWYYGGAGDMALAEQYTIQAIDMRTAVFGEIHPRVAASVSMLSRFYRQQDKWDEAEATARKSVRIAAQIFDEGHPDFTFPLYELASVLNAKGELREARDLFAQIVAWERVSLGPDSHDLGMSMKAYANVLLDLAAYDEAESLLLESLSIFTALAPGSARSLQNTRTDLARLYRATGRYSAAADMLGADKDIVAENLDSPAAIRSRRIELANYYLDIDDVPSARRLLDEMLPATDPDNAAMRPADADLLVLRGRILAASGQSDAAVDALRQALALLIPRWGDDHWQVAVARAELGRAELDNGDLDTGMLTLAAAHSGLLATLGETHPATLAVAATLRDISAANMTK